jgi:hypothetical protein
MGQTGFHQMSMQDLGNRGQRQRRVDLQILRRQGRPAAGDDPADPGRLPRSTVPGHRSRRWRPRRAVGGRDPTLYPDRRRKPRRGDADLPGKMHILWADRVRQTKDPPTVNRGKTPPREPLTSGERRAALIVTGAVVGVVAAGALAWALAGNSSTYDRSGDGCVTVTFPSTMGGGLEHACGAAAQEWCRAADARHDAHATAVQTQCRVARILP